MQRQIFAMLTAIFVVLVAIGCGGQPADEPPGTPAAAQPTEEPADADEADEADEGDTEEEEPTEADEGDTEEEEPTEADEGDTEEEEPTEAEEEEEAPAADTEGSRLQTVIDRGNLICGVNGGLAGFSVQEADGTYTGFDVDFCRAVAAAIFNDPDAVEFVPLSAQERFTAVQAGTVDVLFRNTTWTLSRDTTVFMDFGPTIFYDGQGIMVTADLGIEALEDLNGATICVQSGTTTELNLTDQFRARGIEFEPLVFEEIDATYAAYDEGNCDAVTSDRSQLIARRTVLSEPEAHDIIDVVISKEPLGPAMAQGDSQWRDVVEWTVFATIQAEELGINSENIGEFMDSENPNVRRFMGQEGDLGTGLGLENNFAVNVIEQVGNYAEIYNRNLGPDTPFDLERGQNSLWTEGGLLYSPPFR
jgi:general L-amino acid transport system substrate-binding protein